jgi:hypothetical protein
MADSKIQGQEQLNTDALNQTTAAIPEERINQAASAPGSIHPTTEVDGNRYLGDPDNWDMNFWYRRERHSFIFSDVQDPHQFSGGEYVQYNGDHHFTIISKESTDPPSALLQQLFVGSPDEGPNFYSITHYAILTGMGASVATVEHYPPGLSPDPTTLPMGAVIQVTPDGSVLVEYMEPDSSHPNPDPDPNPNPDPNPIPDPNPDPNPDPDPEPEPGPGPAPDPEPEPEPDPDPEPEPGPDPEPDPGPGPDPEPDPGPGPDPEPDPGPGPDPEPDPEPEPEPGCLVHCDLVPENDPLPAAVKLPKNLEGGPRFAPGVKPELPTREK